MKKNYRTDDDAAATAAVVPMPESVTLAMAELTGALKEGLLALAVGAGLQVVAAVTEESVTELAGPKGRHDPDRNAVRHGSEEGAVTLGGRRVPVRRPRVRSADGNEEVGVPAYQHFSSTDLLGELALERMMAKLSTRRYGAGLEPVGEAVEAAARSTSKSAVSASRRSAGAGRARRRRCPACCGRPRASAPAWPPQPAAGGMGWAWSARATATRLAAAVSPVFFDQSWPVSVSV